MERPRSWMVMLVVIAGISWWINPALLSDIGLVERDMDRIMNAWNNQNSNLVVEIEGRVVRLLPEQEFYGRQQQFLIKLENGHRLKVSNDLEFSSGVPVEVSS